MMSDSLVEFNGKEGHKEFINPKHVFSVRCFGPYEQGGEQPICIMSQTGATVWVVGELMSIVRRLGYTLDYDRSD